MAVALHGNLKDFGLAEVFQLIGQQRKTGLLEIAARGLKMRLAFSDGHVVWAQPAASGEHTALGEMLVRCGLLTRESLDEALRESEGSARPLPALLASSGSVSELDLEATLDLLTQETIFEVLRWSQGSFHFSAQAIPHDRPPEKLLAAEQILMDGLRMVDEWRTFAEQVPSGETVFRRSGSFEVYRQQAQGAEGRRLAEAERIFQLVDGRLTTRRVIDLSRLGTFDATRLLADLRRAGVVESLDPKQARVARKRSRKLRPGAVGEGVRWWLAAAFPLLLLGFLVSSILPSLPARAPGASAARELGSSQPIPRAAFERARQAFEKRRLRHAIEAHRFLTGSWPDTLARLEGGTPLPDGALTSSSGPAYYYVQREDGVLLLAPLR
ncbi:MAG: DUF4388 domain-containing protein [Proteobacteria bacterium]|nr:DUF4388 domain-containing protein [Pseudomonadota bacterium]